MDDRIIAKRYFVSGIVQGVGFRFFAQRTAVSLGVNGYTRNRFDGRVEVYAIGTSELLRTLRALLERGPRGASVSEVTDEDADVRAEYARDFSIEHNA